MNEIWIKKRNHLSMIPRGDNQIWTGDQSVADSCLTAWLCRHMTPTGIEPVLPPWKGDVLTAWPRSQIFNLRLSTNSPSRTWTYDTSVNSRMLYRLSYWGIKVIYLQNFTQIIVTTTLRSNSWSSPRPISNSQLHALLHFHLCPIYLVVFKGSYLLLGGDISSWGGLHA